LMGFTKGIPDCAIPDIKEAVAGLVAQIPPGRVSTYSAVAEALGDARAARAVGAIVGELSHRYNAHRVVYADGAARRESSRLLRAEGVGMAGASVKDLKSRLFTGFETDFPLKALRARQKELARRVKLTSCGKVETVAGIDIAYPGGGAAGAVDAVGAAAVFDLKSGEMTGAEYAGARITFPYIPTYLFYREFPVIEKLARKLDENTVLMLDGNGILHPFGLGIASQVGVELGRTTVGVAKSLLCGTVMKIPQKPCSHSVISLHGKTAGYCLRPGAGRKLLYVSPGNKITRIESLRVITSFCAGAREHPLLAAHRLAREKAKGK
jgi:deoxyribonuclease V